MTLWTAAHQAALSTDSLGKNAGVGCHFFTPTNTINKNKVGAGGGGEVFYSRNNRQLGEKDELI